MKNKIRKIVRLIVLVPLALFLGYCITYFFQNDIETTITDCGIIKSKSNDEVAIKHGTRTQLYLNIEFEKIGFRAQETSPTTYFKYKVGDKVCFDIRQQNGHNVILWSIGGVTLALIAFACIVVLIVYMCESND